jgi:PAS domain S-box-containing protein
MTVTEALSEAPFAEQITVEDLERAARDLVCARENNDLKLLRQQTARAKFGELALKSDKLDEILTEACSLVAEAMNTELAKVMELQEDSETLLVRAGVGWKPGVVGVVTLRIADNTSEGLVLKTGEPMTSRDIATETRFAYPPFLIDNGVKALANVIIIGGQGRPPFGILQIDSRECRQFTADDSAFLRGYANLLAAAVDRLRVVGEVRDGEEGLRLALEAGGLGSWNLDLASGTMTRTPRYERIFGYTDPPPAWTYDIFLEHVLPEDRGLAAGAFRRASDTGTEVRFECRIHRAGDREVRWIEVRGSRLHGRGNASGAHLTGIIVDITDRKQADEALHRSHQVVAEKMAAENAQREIEARFRFATHAGRLGVWELDLQTDKLTASAVCRDNFGHDRDTPFSYAELQNAVHPDDRDRMREAIKHAVDAGTDYDIKCRVIRPDGAMGWVHLYAQVVHATEGCSARLAGISLDITERVLTEARAHQSQRVEAVGRLTAGVAHDFNNVLQTLLGGLELVIDELEDRPDLRTELELALRAGQRGARLTSHLLAFSRQLVLHPIALELAPLLTELSRTLQRTLGRDVVVRIDIAPNLPHVLVDAAHLDSALLNLALNARDAMSGRGELGIEATMVRGQVVIAVTDTGEGMTPEVLGRACDPFFSTKGENGSGLGLSMVKSFVGQSGGELHIKSTPGRGTRIEICLPAASSPPVLAPTPRAQPVRGKGRVLVVDDDVEVARITAAFLQRAGFEVTTATGGGEALRKLSVSPRFDALVADYRMPDMNGADLVLKARELHGDQPALVVTGYASPDWLGRLPSDVATLRKPFQREELVRKINDLIDATTVKL